MNPRFWPIPGNIVVKQIVFDTIAMVIMGVACAWINQDRRKA